MNNEELAKRVLEEFLNRARPGEPPGPSDELIRIAIIERHYLKLVDLVKRDELAPELMDTLLAYARDPAATPRTTFARRVLSEASEG